MCQTTKFCLEGLYERRFHRNYWRVCRPVGISGMATLFNLMDGLITDTADQISQLGTLSTMLLLVTAIILIVKVRVISSLLVGAVAGAVIKILLEMNNINIANEVYSVILNTIG